MAKVILELAQLVSTTTQGHDIVALDAQADTARRQVELLLDPGETVDGGGRVEQGDAGQSIECGEGVI
jgi:hypothetical protein